MSNAIDSTKLSNIIETSTKEIISQTETFLQTVKEEPAGKETVAVMINGKVVNLSKKDYNTLKEQNDIIRKKMKGNIKTTIKEFKESIHK